MLVVAAIVLFGDIRTLLMIHVVPRYGDVQLMSEPSRWQVALLWSRMGAVGLATVLVLASELTAWLAKPA